MIDGLIIELPPPAVVARPVWDVREHSWHVVERDKFAWGSSGGQAFEREIVRTQDGELAVAMYSAAYPEAIYVFDDSTETGMRQIWPVNTGGYGTVRCT